MVTCVRFYVHVFDGGEDLGGGLELGGGTPGPDHGVARLDPVFDLAEHLNRFIRVHVHDKYSSGCMFMINTRAQRKLLHTWIILVTVKEYLVQNG